MTINELIERLNEIGAGGDMTLRIAAMGGMRHGKNVANATLGFDWDMGTVVLHPDVPLTIKGPQKPGHCKHTSTHWRVNPREPHVGRSVEVCNECGMSRGHWEDGSSGWMNADIDDFPPRPWPWISVDERLPTHNYTVLVWVAKGRLVVGLDDDGYMDVGGYNPETKQWMVSNGIDDEVVDVSHWSDVPAPQRQLPA